MQRLEPDQTESPTAERYKPLFELGQGGMGVVTLALSRGPEGFAKLVVLKRLHPHLMADPATVQMFLDEARVSARLSHQNVVQVYEVADHRGAPVIVMQYLEGQPLSALLAAPDRLPLDVHVAILAHALHGLSAAHELVDFDGSPLRLVHRDMSPHNILVDYDGQAKVLDFGIAKIMGAEEQTRTGVLKGKLRYMSPEQAAGGDVDCRSDVFCVGIMLWEAIAGRRLWKETGEAQVLRALLDWRVPELDAESAPRRLVEICERALAFDPEDRYSTAKELRRDLQEYLDGRSGSVEEALSKFLDRHFAEERAQTRERVAERIKNASSAPPDITPAAREVTRREARPPTRAPLMAMGALVAVASLVALAATLARPDARSTAAPSGSLPAVPCAAGTKACAGECVSVEHPDYGCGSEACAPCSTPNATPRCSRDHQCDIAVCYRGYENCDGDSDNGCEADLRTDPDHCGACSVQCPEAPHAQVACGDSCRIWRCSPGFEDCNGSLADGCETQVEVDRKNCGACGVRCAAGHACRGARCDR